MHWLGTIIFRQAKVIDYSNGVSIGVMPHINKGDVMKDFILSLVWLYIKYGIHPKTRRGQKIIDRLGDKGRITRIRRT